MYKKYLSTVVLGIVLLTTGLISTAVSAGDSSMKKKPNIILVFADDISAKEFPTYRIPNRTYPDDAPCTTPVLEMMKNEGVQFKDFWATPLCHPSRGLIMTGRYAHRTQWWSNGFGPGDGDPGSPVYDYHLTLGVIAHNAGYKCQMIGKWQLGGEQSGYKFDEYVMTPGKEAARSDPAKKTMGPNGKGKPSFYWNPGYSLSNHPTESGGYKTNWDDFAAEIEVKYMKDFMGRKVDEQTPFFVYWTSHMGHQNWDFDHDGMGYPGVPPMDPNFYPGTQKIDVLSPDGKLVKKTPPGMNYHVQYLDYCVGELIRHCEKLGVMDNTVIIVTTDNGTTEHGKGLKGCIRERGAKVPLFVYAPGFVKARGETEELSDLSDIAPTIAALTGSPLPPDYEFDGKNLVPFLTGQTDKHRDWIFSYNAEMRMVRTKNVMMDGIGQLFDTRGSRDQEDFPKITDKVPRKLKADVVLIESILEKIPGPDLDSKIYKDYLVDKAGNFPRWEVIKKAELTGEKLELPPIEE